MLRHRLIITAVALASLAVPSAASAADRDHDKMRDSWEKHFKLNPKKNDARKDKDHDGLKNLQEFRAGTNPRRDDTDKDGIRDGDEGAGVIKSFDSATGVLVIDVFGSDTDLTGKVDSTTEIECEGDDDDRPATTPGDTRGDGTPEDHARESSDDDSGSGHSGSDDDGDHSGSNSGPSENSGPGHVDDDDRGDDDARADDDPDHKTCGTDQLVAGRTVKEAKLNEGDDGPADVFHEVEIEG